MNPIDYKIRRGDFRFLTGKDTPKNRILGFDICGEVLETGNRVTQFQVGNKVFAMSPIRVGGGNAEIAVLPEDNVALLPENMDFTQGAGVPLAALTAYQALKYKSRLCMGERILINGASGGVGIFAIQIAKAMGAHVTAVCNNKNMDAVKQLGADRVLDYNTEAFTSDYNAYDIVFDVAGNSSFRQCQGCLKPYGYYVTTQPSLQRLLKAACFSLFPGKKDVCIIVKPDGKDLKAIAELIKKEKIKTVIDRTFQLNDLADAHQYCETERIMGKSIIIVQEPPKTKIDEPTPETGAAKTKP